jgi:hypothetical protein
MKALKNRKISLVDSLKSKIRRLERELEASQNKSVISHDVANPFLVHQQEIMQQIRSAKDKLKKIQKDTTTKVDEVSTKRQETEVPVKSIQEKIQELHNKIAFIKAEIPGAGRRKSQLKTAVRAIQNQIQALKDKQHVLVRLTRNTLTSPIDSSPIRKNLKNSSPKKLQKRINSNQTSLNTNVTVGWEDIKFQDGTIKIRVAKLKFIQFPFLKSRRSYEYIKPYLIRKGIEPLQLQISHGRIRAITNLDLLESAIQILKIQTEWNKKLGEGEGATVSAILASLKDLNQNYFNFFFKNKNLTPYLKELCDKQALEYHLIPVLEPTASKHTIAIEKESFLFTVKSKASIYIIWESVEINKATFIFTTTQENYFDDLQKIFDYISSRVTSKRRNLRKGISNSEDKQLQSYRTIYHTTLEKWNNKLREYIM